MHVVKQSTAFTDTVGPVLDSTGAEYTGAVIGDISISKNGTEAAMAAAATLTHISNGMYTLVFTTGNTDTLGRLVIRCNKSTYQMPPVRYEVLASAAFDTLVTNGTLASTTSGRTIATSAAGIADANLAQALGTAVTCTTAGVPIVDVSRINNVSASAVTTIKAVQGIAVDGVITTVTNQLTAAQIATGVWQDAVAGDFTTASSIGKALYVANVAPGGSGGIAIVGSAMTLAANQHVIVDSGTVTTVTNQLTSAQIATGVWTDTTAGDFTVSLSVGKSIMNGVSLGTGLTVARCTLTDTLTTYTGNTVQTGDSYARIGAAGVGLTSVALASSTSDAVIAGAVWNAATATYGSAGSYGLLIETDLDATVSSRLASASYTAPTNLTAAQIATGVWQDATAGDFTVSLSMGKCLYTSGNAPGAASGISIVGSAMTLTSAYDAAKTAGTSTLTQTQVTGGAYSIQSASCVLGDARIANLDATVSSRGTSTLTQTQVTGGAYSVQSASCVLGDARIANLDATVSSRGTSTLTQTQVTGGAYTIQSASCVLGDARIAYLDVATSSRLASASYTTPPTVAAIRAEIDSNSTQLAKLGVPTNADLATDIADIPALLLQYPLAPGSLENGSVGQALAAPFTEKFASATTTTVTFRTLFSSTVDDAYKDSIIQLTSGAGEGQWRYITAYVGSTHTATLNRAWDVTPSANDQFILRPATRSSISPTANENADALLARTDGIETNVTPKQALRAAMALSAGKVTGAGTGTEIFYAPDGSTARMTFTVDSSGNRTVSVNL